MHTNYDVLGMAELSEKILGIRDTEVLDETMEDTEGNKEGIGRVGTLESPMTLEECCVYVKHKLNLGSIKVFGDMDKKVQRLAVSPGSGKTAIAAALKKGADVLVTGTSDIMTALTLWSRAFQSLMRDITGRNIFLSMI